MADDNTHAQAQPQTPKPNPVLKSLDKLVGTWKLSGPTIKGQVTFEWLEGGFFLVQHGDLEQNGMKIKSIEYIEYEQKWGADEPSKDCTSHVFDNMGHHFEYVWEVGDDTLTS